MNKKTIVFITLSIIILITIWLLREPLIIEFYNFKGIYFSKSIDKIPGYKHLPKRFSNEIKDKKIKNICKLELISDEDSIIENNNISKLLIKIINKQDTEVGFYQLKNNYYEQVGGKYNYISYIFRKIVRDNNKKIIGIEMLDINNESIIQFNFN